MARSLQSSIPCVAAVLAAVFSGCAGVGMSKSEARSAAKVYSVAYEEAYKASTQAAEKLGLNVWGQEKDCFMASRGPGILQGSKDVGVCLARLDGASTLVQVNDGGLSIGIIAKPDAVIWSDKFFDELGRELNRQASN